MPPPPPASRRARTRLTHLGLTLALIATPGATLGLTGPAAADGTGGAGVVPPLAPEQPASEQPASEQPGADPTGDPTDGPTRDPEPDPEPDPPDYRFLSSPDFLNLDVGDISGVYGWDAGDPNSINDSYVAALDVVMNAFAAEEPEDVLVAGDLVEGHWGMDDAKTGIFGPTDSFKHRKGHIRRAAKTYYGIWTDRFADRGLQVHTVPGDHEMGDNNWKKDGNFYNRFKYRTLGLFRRMYSRNMVEPAGYRMRPGVGRATDTAYAVKLSPEVLLVSVDVWQKTSSDVAPRLDDAQLRWLDRVLARAKAQGVDYTMVQGHVPVLRPVRTIGSSGIHYAGGKRSAFWETLSRNDVDLYLAGEVHDITARRAGGVTQITHGGLFGYGGTNYLVGEVRGDELAMTIRRFDSTIDRSTKLWQTDTRRSGPGTIDYQPDPPVVGTMTVDSSQHITERSGLLDPYRPSEGDARSSADPLPGVRE